MRPRVRIGGHRQRPCHVLAGEPKWFAEAANGIQYMPVNDLGDALVDDQGVTFLATAAIKANLALRRDKRR